MDMSAKSVALEISPNTRIYISARRARQLLKSGKVEIAAQVPFTLRLKQEVVRWTERSSNFVMNGALLMKVRA